MKTRVWSLLPKPGTDAAIKAGCKCPVMDNHGGKGRYGDGKKAGWFVSGNCKMHWEGKDGT